MQLGWMALALALLLPAEARAHGKLRGSNPKAGAHLGMVPRELRLEFSEVPALAFSRVRLASEHGADVALGTLAYAADSRRAVVAPISGVLAAGSYTVHWQFAGDDGHPVRGSFEFTVAPGAMSSSPPGQAMAGHDMAAMADTAPHEMHHDPASMPEGPGFGVESPAYVALRWLQFAALLLAIGSVAFRQLVLPRAGWQAGGSAPVLLALESRAARAGLAAVVLLLVTLMLRLVAQSAAMHAGGDAWDAGRIADMLATTAWGQGWIVQLAGVVVATTGLGAAATGSRGGWTIATAGVVLLALSASLGGHAAAMPEGRRIAIAADALHVLAAGGWLGTLAVMLVTAIRPRASGLADGDAILAGVVRGFSAVALGSAAVVVATGVFAAWLHLGRIPALWGTRYGVTLLLKLGVLALVAVTGFYNWRVVQPALGTEGATMRLRRSATAEVAVAVLVLLVTAVLVATPTGLDP